MRFIPCFFKFLSKAKVVTGLIKRIWCVSYWLFLLEPTEAPQLQPCKASCGERLNVTLTWTVGADILTTLKYKILNSSKLSRGRVFGMCTQYVWWSRKQTGESEKYIELRIYPILPVGCLDVLCVLWSHNKAKRSDSLKDIFLIWHTYRSPNLWNG